ERAPAGRDRLREGRAAASGGPGTPDAFRRTLTDLGANVAAFRAYPDHFAYGRADVDALDTWGRSLPRDAALVTTQKDLVKLRVASLGGRPLWALRVAWRVGNGRGGVERHLRPGLPNPSEARPEGSEPCAAPLRSRLRTDV